MKKNEWPSKITIFKAYRSTRPTLNETDNNSSRSTNTSVKSRMQKNEPNEQIYIDKIELKKNWIMNE